MIFRKINIIILKKPDKKNYYEPKIYCSIIFLDIIGKFLENIIAKKINNFIESNNLFSHIQINMKYIRNPTIIFEFLIKQIYRIWDINYKYIISVLYLNIIGIFDYILYTKLLYNLRKYRLSEYIINWIQNFL